jgi:hypothetical protein
VPAAAGGSGGWEEVRARWRRFGRRVRAGLLVVGVLVGARLLLPTLRFLRHGCVPSLGGDALTAGVAALTFLVLAWATSVLWFWRALRRWALAVQIASGLVAALDFAVGIRCRFFA